MSGLAVFVNIILSMRTVTVTGDNGVAKRDPFACGMRLTLVASIAYY